MTTSTGPEVRGAVFTSFADPSFRLVVGAASVNQAGNWFVIVGVNVIVLRLTDSGVALGIVNALTTGPALLGGLVIGPLADRLDRLRLVRGNAVVNLVVTVGFAAMVAADLASLPLLYLLSLLSGCTTAVDNPVRKALVGDLAGPGAVANAVALFGTSLTAAEIVALLGSGALVTGPGVVWCFVLGVACAVGQVGMLAAVRWRAAARETVLGGLGTAIRDGLSYALREPSVRACLVLSCAVGMFGYSIHPVLLPLLSTRVLDAGAGGYPLLAAMVEIGCLLAGFVVAAWPVPRLRVAVWATALFGLADGTFVLTGDLLSASSVAAVVGVGLMVAMWAAQSITQTVCAPEFRGRIFALQAVGFSGSALIGGPLAGWMADTWGLAASFLTCTAATVVVAAGVLATRPRDAVQA